MQRISVGLLPTRKIVAEHHWSIKTIRAIVNGSPMWAIPMVLMGLKVMGLCGRCWPIWWRFIAQDALPENAQVKDDDLQFKRSLKILKSLGKAPSQIDTMGDFKYRLPFWWVLATRANKLVLNWAQEIGVDFYQRRDGVGFLYACLASQNNEALEWALKMGIPVNDIDTRGNSLLAFTLHRTTHEDPTVINLLISYGACWYYKGPLGENGEDVLKLSPEWSRWRLWEAVHDVPSVSRPCRKM